MLLLGVDHAPQAQFRARRGGDVRRLGHLTALVLRPTDSTRVTLVGEDVFQGGASMKQREVWRTVAGGW